MRRRSVDMISGDVLEPANEGPPRSVSARRRATNSAPTYEDSAPPSWQPSDPEAPPADAPIRKVTGATLCARTSIFEYHFPPSWYG